MDPEAKIALIALVALVALSSSSTPREPKPGKRLTKADLVALAARVGFPDPNLAAAVAMAESGGNPRSLNHNPPIEISAGLWQINTLAHKKHTVEQLYDVDTNAKTALEIYKAAKGWKPWGAFTNGSYKKYL